MLTRDNVTATPLFGLSAVHQDTNEVFRRFVKRDGTRAGARDRVAGVSRVRSAEVGDDLPLDMAGAILVEAGAAIGADDYIESDADGRAVPWTGPRRVVVTGAAADTDIDVAGIRTTDTPVTVVATDGTAVPNVTIPSDGHIQSTGATTGKNLIVEWPNPPVGQALQAAAAAGDYFALRLGLA